MANNFAALIPRIISGAQDTLRENAVTPRLVNRSYSPAPGVRGSTVDVPIPAKVPARAVVSSTAFPTNSNDTTPTVVPIAMDQWFVADFTLNDKEKLEVMNGIMPMNAAEAIKSLANKVDTYVLGLYKQFYSAVGTAGTTPFASGIDAAVDARTMLNRQLAPMSDRNAIIDPIAEGNALKQAPFRDASQSTDNGPIIEGDLGRKLGFNWYMNQNVLSHTAGTATGLTVATNTAAGATTVTFDGTILPITASGNGTLVEGDIITIAGQTQQYRVVADATVTTATNVSIAPALKFAVTATTVITKVASHVANLAFNRNAIALASRPMEGTVEPGLGVIVSTVIDPLTQLAFRLQVQRQYMQTLYSFDVLFGAKVIRPELGTRILG